MDDDQEWEHMCDMSIYRTLQRIMDSISDEEEVRQRGGSRPGKAANRERERKLQAELFQKKYFSVDLLYDEKSFRRCYCASFVVYVGVVGVVETMRPERVGAVALLGFRYSCFVSDDPTSSGHLYDTGALFMR